MQIKKGLSDKEVAESRVKHGSNGFAPVKPISFVRRWLGNFGDPMLLILLAALLASSAIQILHYVKGKDVELLELLGIAMAILLASLTSAFFEHKNESSFQALQESANKVAVKVYRNHKVSQIFIDDVVVGDWIMLGVGDKIPADGYIVWGSVSVDQSMLNGESKEAHKSESPLILEAMGDDLLDAHQVYRGTTVLDGQAHMVVLAVGEATIYGSIAKSLTHTEERDTPLKVKLKVLAKLISRIGYMGGLLMALIFFSRQAMTLGSNWEQISTVYANDFPKLVDHILQALMMAVVLIVVAVPEGLPLMIAIVSAMMMRRMLKDNVLVRTNSGIETAGSLNILFTDKTGTITKGALEVVTLWQAGAIQKSANKILIETILHSAQSEYSEEQGGAIGGNSTDRALLNWVMSHYASMVNTITERKILDRVAFNSDRKWSAVVIEHNGSPLSLIKGAPERLLPLAMHYYNAENKILAFDEEKRQEMEQLMHEWSSQSMRILAFATRAGAVDGQHDLDGSLVLMGLIAIRDEIRPEVIPAINQVRRAGVQVVMVTGDRKETAVAIAKEAGILDEDGIALDSSQLNLLSDAELVENLPKLAVVARALPADKSRLVRLAQSKNWVVGMTGDGVNDSPALKLADVGFAMGSGTEVAKEAGDIIIMDDNFVSIRQALLYGRTIYKNIQRFMVFQLTINLSALLVTLLFPLLGFDPPLTITQMLWVNLVMDSLAALAFGGEVAVRRYLNEAPKRRDEPILRPFMLEQITVIGVLIFAISVYMIYSADIRLFFPYEQDIRSSWSTAYFTFFVLAALVNAFNVRTNRLNPLSDIMGNLMFLKVMAGILLIQILLSSFSGPIMHGYGISFVGWFIVGGLAGMVFLAGLVHKLIRTQVRRNE
ncbi:calcium-translocating P-type ATPase, PMCA-type [Entomospira culicis]|uniref:P-type Ca(2+) transporter n=1 Tax=Entomospira culicis TaxID=2719989 RepID=A0A968GHC4_9SPIO|nr:calcium-translocating P-type ATPase, PMCA-type [Entomospira culicis]NIZ19935.1 calcium-translocating P-type ATPase, PMCA-type [Entomospira culicis]NIZ70108.1 calcium-translocating P-type ATPase, PMCA-type [Entomospira culicis]WDI38035.1 calcium-translocating P-type ATPase, PMCA-type [Entomospira culicis]WDI39658.1 calcium-translocating P-type ATPase, PMCA-type [Entomospira culicis]